MAAAVIWRGAELLLIRRPPAAPLDRSASDRGWWAGMWQFPSGEVRPEETVRDAAVRLARELAGLEVIPEAAAGVVRHGVTRWKITLEARHCRLALDEPARSPGGAVTNGATTESSPDSIERRWVTLDELAHLGLPAPHRRLVEQVERQLASGVLQVEQPLLLEV
jgi:A/G-specific adenine glycosylase